MRDGDSGRRARNRRRVREWEAQGKTTLFVAVEGVLVGAIAAADTLRPEVPAAAHPVARH